MACWEKYKSSRRVQGSSFIWLINSIQSCNKEWMCVCVGVPLLQLIKSMPNLTKKLFFFLKIKQMARFDYRIWFFGCHSHQINISINLSGDDDDDWSVTWFWVYGGMKGNDINLGRFNSINNTKTSGDFI